MRENLIGQKHTKQLSTQHLYSCPGDKAVVSFTKSIQSAQKGSILLSSLFKETKPSLSMHQSCKHPGLALEKCPLQMHHQFLSFTLPHTEIDFFNITSTAVGNNVQSVREQTAQTLFFFYLFFLICVEDVHISRDIIPLFSRSI